MIHCNLLNKEKKGINNKNIYQCVKSDYFLKLLFDNIKKKKSMDIVRYNKNIRKRINININDYKEYSEKYSSIEIEIKPVNNKYGTFINIECNRKYRKYRKYYHIFFNNVEKEIKRNYINKDEEIKTIKIVIDYQIETFDKLFEDYKYIESICFKKFCRNNIHNMCNMFSGCSLLKGLNLNNFNTNNVTDMSHCSINFHH